MRKLWHSYSVFLSRGYELGVLVISPIGIFLFFLLLNSVIGGNAVMLARVTFFSYLVIYEVISDYWLFGGICKRDANGLEHLKSAFYGLDVIRAGLIGDLLRRLVYLLVYGCIFYCMFGQAMDFVLIFLVYASSVAVLNLSRHTPVWQMQMLVSFLGTIVFDLLFVFFWIACEMAESSTVVIVVELLIAIILSILVSVFTIWYMMSCVKKSYFEKE